MQTADIIAAPIVPNGDMQQESTINTTRGAKSAPAATKKTAVKATTKPTAKPTSKPTARTTIRPTATPHLHCRRNERQHAKNIQIHKFKI